MSSEFGDGIRPSPLESGQTEFWLPNSGRPDLARKFRPERPDPYRLAKIWPERADSRGSGKIRPTLISTKLFGFWPLSWILAIVAGMAESDKSGRNLVGQ